MVFRSSFKFKPFTSTFNRWRTSAHPLLLWSQRVLFWLPIGVAFTKYGYTLKSISGRSMQPTLNPDVSLGDDVVVFERYSGNSLHTLNRGDIVAVKSPHELGRLLVKRIVGLPGDTVRTLPPYPDKEVHLTKGQIWIEGDESFHSQDSNHFGPISLSLVDSKLTFIIYPFERFGPIIPPAAKIAATSKGRPSQRDLDAYMREKRRMERVTIGGGSGEQGNPTKNAKEGAVDELGGKDTLKGFEEGLEAVKRSSS